jgi:hypothetical protein
MDHTNSIPKTVEEMAAKVAPFSPTDLNRAQSAEIQQMLASGKITVAQAQAWSEANRAPTYQREIEAPGAMRDIRSKPMGLEASSASDAALPVEEAPSAPFPIGAKTSSATGTTTFIPSIPTMIASVPPPPQNAPGGGMPTSGAGTGGDVHGRNVNIGIGDKTPPTGDHPA